MNYCGVRALAAILCLAAFGWCQFSSGQTQAFQPGQAFQQNQPKAITPPAPDGRNQFLPDSSMCNPTANNDGVANSRKSSNPRAKPPSSLPATTAPGSTAPCVGTSGTVNSPAGTKQAEPPRGPSPAKPMPNRQNNSPSPFDSMNQLNVSTNVPRVLYACTYQTQSGQEPAPDGRCRS